MWKQYRIKRGNVFLKYLFAREKKRKKNLDIILRKRCSSDLPAEHS